MKSALFAILVAGLLLAVCASSFAMVPGQYRYAGYDVVITPDDPEHPGQSGTITITNEEGTVDLYGTYLNTEDRPPLLVVDLAGTIVTAEGVIEVQRTFTFEPKTKRMVWKQIVSWIESVIAG